jgi:phosphoglycerate dehydrogenase-like enzyme
MTDIAQNPIRVIVAVDFSDEIMEQLTNISDKLQIERHFPNVPDDVYTDAEVLYTIRHYPEPEQAPLLRWIQLHHAGVERTLKLPIVQAEDVEVTTASGIHVTPIAEYCLGMMLTFMYKIPQMLKFKEETRWPESKYTIFKPHGLRGLTLGIAGYGSIGREVARIADAMGMTVLATKHNLMSTDEKNYMEKGTGDPTGDIPERLYPAEALLSMARECDFLVIATPLTEKTHHLVDEVVLDAMKESAILINISRGAVVDEAALVSALASEKIAGAALDVFETEPLPKTSPLWNLDNAIISPHVSGNSILYNEKAAALFMENLQRYVDKRPLLNRISRELGY